MKKVLVIVLLTGVCGATEPVYFIRSKDKLLEVPKMEAVKVLILDELDKEVVYKCNQVVVDPKTLQLRSKK